jgi:hypothetical protein
MSASSTISLFSERPDVNQKPYSFVFSIVAHVTVIGLIFVAILSAPKVKTMAIAERYEVRHLDLHTLESEMKSARNEVKTEDHSTKSITAPRNESENAPAALQMMVKSKIGTQTLVQPDLPKPIELKSEIPLPSVVIWAAKKVTVKTIVPPPPAPPPVAMVNPSVQLPNEEQTLAEVSIPSSPVAKIPQPIQPSTSSPVIVAGPKPTPPAPITSAAGSSLPAPAAILSLSNQKMANGAVALPPVNSSAAANKSGVMGGQNKDQASAGQGSKSGQAPGGGGANANSGQGSGLGVRPATTRINRPREGAFGSVVVGSSLIDKYPELSEVWNGRMSYTVYLSVGLAHSWLLQYTLSRADSTPGGISHIEAPWPYSIVRPNIAPGAIDADALMVHGFVNQAGRFEALSIAFPPDFAQAAFVLQALSQWEFRPATQNGQSIRVEVLLIIPEVAE